MLSPAKTEGHRTFLAQTPFSSFTVTFTNGIEVFVNKRVGNLLGSFTYVIKKNNILIAKFHYKADATNTIKPDYVDSEKEDIFLKKLQSLQINIYQLSADRKSDTNINSVSLGQEEQPILITLPGGTLDGSGVERADKLTVAARSVEVWFRQRALRGTNAGEANTNSIYTGIINQIAHSHAADKAPSLDSKQAIQTLIDLKLTEAESYSKFGLTSPLHASQILETIKTCPKARLPFLHNVLEPFISSVKARLDALEEAQNAISTFVQQINSFFTYKSIDFHLRDGITVRTDKRHSLF